MKVELISAEPIVRIELAPDQAGALFALLNEVFVHPRGPLDGLHTAIRNALQPNAHVYTGRYRAVTTPSGIRLELTDR